MNKKCLFFGLLLLVCLFNPILEKLHTSEVDKGFVILDRKPWKISWIQEDEQIWVLVANFDRAELRTYFTKAPPSKGFGLSHENKPIKQEFNFYFAGKFSTTNCQYEQWPDGAKGYSFIYGQQFKRDGKKYTLETTAIIEEVGDAENEIRYAIYRDF